MPYPGPPSLGRGVVVDGDAAPPAPWASAPVVVVDESVLQDPSAVVARLHRAWSEREPVVVRLHVDAGRFRAPRSYPLEPWTLPADFELWHDRLQFLVWANNYDARGADAAVPVWWWGRKALRLGATATAAEGPGDVVVPGGRPAWVDGGPRGAGGADDLDGAVVVHRESVERDGLDPAPPPVASGATLAADQRAAVAHPAGPARIIAPAGSGKTRVLTERLRHLSVDRRWERSAVLAVAYNKKAQQELDGRCADFRPRTRTLNSLGLALLAQAHGRVPATLDERDVRRIVERLAPTQRHRANTDPIGPYLEALSLVRLGLRDPADVEASRDDVPGLAALWLGFVEELRAGHAVDFDHQVYGAVEALLADGELRATAQLAHRHLLVDEFQDLTPAHVLLLRLLATPGLDCFGVGDDDQVIYGHAGADPGFLIDYDRLFPGAASHPLEVNYRCPAEVVEAAVHLLGYNRRRVPKAITAARPAGPTGTLDIRLHPAGGGAADLVEVVTAWRAEGAAPGTMAVLARVNSLLLAPHVALVEAGLPVASTVRADLVERTGLRAAFAYLRLATAPDGHIAGRDLVEILRRPSRGLPPWFADRVRRRARWSATGLQDIAASVPEKDAAKVERLVGDVVALRSAAAGGAGAARLLQLVRDDVGLGGAMTLLDRGKGGEGSSHVDDLEALEQVARLHEDPATLEGWIRERLERAPDPDGVVLSTVHRVKGMEWDRVVVYGVTAGILPHRLADDDEEERRVLHVAVTRGRDRVAVLADRSRPSPFVDELTGAAPPPAAAPLRAGTAGPSPRAGREADGRRTARPPVGGGEAPGGTVPADPALEEALRAWRKARSTRDGVPAYVVFADKTLRAIAASRPASLAALRAVDGIGPTKLELYGDDILALVEATPAGAPDVG